ncbi:MAG: ATP synthase F1 subunit gamma [Defluviitaleaceae bacterium]|nr:ATP synthase F1 subunit gamma [Defluviitaleaceae bacterium]
MSNMRDIKRKIKSVKNTQQITKAMNLVSTSKLQRMRARLRETRPYYVEMQNTLKNIIACSNKNDLPFLKQRKSGKTLVIAITGDKGLCGGYNSNVIKEAMSIINSRSNVEVLAFGDKGLEYFKSKGITPRRYVTGVSDKPSYEDVLEISNYALYEYARGEASEVLLCYTVFNSPISQEVKTVKILPIEGDVDDIQRSTKDNKSNMQFEPSAEAVFKYIVPKYVNALIYGALIEAATCELSARSTSMDNATKNAEERINDMTVLYNRIRQGTITQEITEIVAGANAI